MAGHNLVLESLPVPVRAHMRHPPVVADLHIHNPQSTPQVGCCRMGDHMMGGSHTRLEAAQNHNNTHRMAVDHIRVALHMPLRSTHNQAVALHRLMGHLPLAAIPNSIGR